MSIRLDWSRGPSGSQFQRMSHEFGHMACKILTSCRGDEVDCGGVISGTSPRTCVAVVLTMCRGENSSSCRASKRISCSYVGRLVYRSSFDG